MNQRRRKKNMKLHCFIRILHYFRRKLRWELQFLAESCSLWVNVTLFLLILLFFSSLLRASSASIRGWRRTVEVEESAAMLEKRAAGGPPRPRPCTPSLRTPRGAEEEGYLRLRRPLLWYCCSLLCLHCKSPALDERRRSTRKWRGRRRRWWRRKRRRRTNSVMFTRRV